MHNHPAVHNLQLRETAVVRGVSRNPIFYLFGQAEPKKQLVKDGHRHCRDFVSHRRLFACASPRVRDTTLAPQRRWLPEHHPLYKDEPKIRCSLRRSWPDKSGRDRPRKNSYPYSSLVLLQRRPVHLRALGYYVTSVSIERRGYRASCSRRAERCSVALISLGFSGLFSPYSSQTSCHA